MYKLPYDVRNRDLLNDLLTVPSLCPWSSRSIQLDVSPTTGLADVSAVFHLAVGKEKQPTLGVHFQDSLQMLVLLHGLLVIHSQVRDRLVLLGDCGLHTENGQGIEIIFGRFGFRNNNNKHLPLMYFTDLGVRLSSLFFLDGGSC